MGEYLHIDLCCGVGGWQAPFETDEKWTTVGVDIRQDLAADVIGDVRNLPIDCQPTVLTCSPPCTAFTRYSLPWLDEPNPSMDLVEACLDAVDGLEPDYWILENVQGLKQYWDRTESKRAGPYYLWGEFPSFDVEITSPGKMQTSGENPERRAEIPYELAQSLKKAVEWSI